MAPATKRRRKDDNEKHKKGRKSRDKDATKDDDSGVSLTLLLAKPGLQTGILQYLHWNDLNEVACVSRVCRAARNNPVLDQTREAVIRFLPPYKQIPADTFHAIVARWAAFGTKLPVGHVNLLLATVCFSS